ncbi:hypothetical protein FK531_10320 [Rhodococcus spelaei]|uniref:Transmembrane protein n=1 Tax=Rhodococcus spelaei TaxID=2546320 RepID=A0A541BA52_9NOCA|nr:hypothetical protein [Rhodococcus spelaei]TQF69153.1 hypothetical protein FK531_10320 [Rhodococcus spelaei]
MIARPAGLPRAVPSLYSLALAMLILGPLLGPGHLLLRDAVSTPRSYLTDSALGLTDAAARAVPQDALLAVLSPVLDGGLVVKAILLAALWLAGWGAARMVATLLPTAGLGAQLLASTVTLWNPYVAERLLQGHWSLLTGYAALPWTVLAMYRLRRTGRPWSWRAWSPLAVALAAAALTPTGALLAATLALVLAAVPGGVGARWSRLALTATTAVLASAPWLTATALSGAGAQGSDPAGVAAFAARAEPGLGTLGSLAGLGGIWNSEALPGSRSGLWAPAGTVVVLAIVVCGLPALWLGVPPARGGRRGNPVLVALAVVAATAVVLPALGATGWGLQAGEWAVVHVPGAGLLRDAQKWVALAVPFYALAAAAGVPDLARLCRRVFGDRGGLPPPADRKTSGSAAAAVGIVALLIALPDLAWGVGGALRPVHYPPSWAAVGAELDGQEGDVAVLPGGTFRRFPYTGTAPVLDPAPRMLPLDVPQTGRLVVGSRHDPTFTGGSFIEIGGEGDRAEQVEAVLLGGMDPRHLADLGVGWVLVERDSSGPLDFAEGTLAQLEPVFADEHLSLYRVPGELTPVPDRPAARGAAVAAHLVWAALLAGGALGCVLGRYRRNRADQA